MRYTKAILLSACCFQLGACGVTRAIAPPPGPARVNPASVAADPAQWNGREVEMIGLLVWEPDHRGLYQSYGAYCRNGDRTAVYVDWEKWTGVTAGDNRRRVTVRGVLRGRDGSPSPPGQASQPAIAVAPLALEPGSVTRWLSNPQAACPNRLGQ